MDERYKRNLPALSQREQAMLQEKRVLVAGCGGLGGYLVEYLTRLGVGHLTAVDGDQLTADNLNRQLLATDSALGQSKAEAAKARALSIRPAMDFRAVRAYMTPSNADDLIKGQDLALDALDSAESRLLLEDACARAGIYLIHGAVDGWTAQMAVLPPGSGLLHRLYSSSKSTRQPSALAFTPALCASMQAAQAVKLLCGRAPIPTGKLWYIDMDDLVWQVLPL